MELSTPLETGDLLLFSASQGCFQKAIQCASCSIYNHAAIVLKDPTWLRNDLYGYYVLESTLDNSVDVLTNKYIFGVQIQTLDNALKPYKDTGGHVYVRHLNCDRTQAFYNSFENIIRNVEGKPYDIILRDWIHAEIYLQLEKVNYKCCGFKRRWLQRNNTFWCSAICCEVYVKLGLLDPSTPWTVISPKELGEETCDKKLQWINGASLSSTEQYC